MLTKEQEIDLIDDLEDNLCTSTLASIARCLTIEKHVLQAELDRLKAERISTGIWGEDTLERLLLSVLRFSRPVADVDRNAISEIIRDRIALEWSIKKAGDTK